MFGCQINNLAGGYWHGGVQGSMLIPIMYEYTCSRTTFLIFFIIRKYNTIRIWYHKQLERCQGGGYIANIWCQRLILKSLCISLLEIKGIWWPTKTPEAGCEHLSFCRHYKYGFWQYVNWWKTFLLWPYCCIQKRYTQVFLFLWMSIATKLDVLNHSSKILLP